MIDCICYDKLDYYGWDYDEIKTELRDLYGDHEVLVTDCNLYELYYTVYVNGDSLNYAISIDRETREVQE